MDDSDSLNDVEKPSETHPTGGEVVDDSAEIETNFKNSLPSSMEDSLNKDVEDRSQKHPTGGLDSADTETITDSNSKRDTGFVGIVKNNGEKHYLNALLQMLYHIPYIRELVKNGLASPIQKLFSDLAMSNDSVLKEGIFVDGSSLLVDFQSLCQDIKDATKLTEEEVGIGKFLEALELDAVNFNNVHASVENYLGSLTSLPPVLVLHLVTSCCDDKDKEVGTVYSYPYQLDLNKFVSSDADNIYTLHSVLLENGGGDNCCAMITPKLSNYWYKFEDDQVTVVGYMRGQEKVTKGYNPLMLIYCRKAERNLFRCIDEKEISAKLKTKEIKPSEVCSFCSNVAHPDDDMEDFGVTKKR
ncbi:hypothetical protein AALP_AAs61459U000400 [Arabis alpina]|uniref:USP domain-containing protein n=1 Tax=Arabis alpina TaxID=50452 RepID=A0A087G2P4_ARAAL|nr:hypothetical protein AALP_AAs61459U000400 [Arabis alpina]